MPVNGFSFLDEKFFIVLSFNSHSVEFACWVLCGKNQERRRLAGRLIQNATERLRGHSLVQDRCGVLRHPLRIVRENPRYPVFLENLARFFARQKLCNGVDSLG